MPPSSNQQVPQSLQTVYGVIHAVASYIRPDVIALPNGVLVVQVWINPQVSVLVSTDGDYWYLQEAALDSSAGEPHYSEQFRLDDRPIPPQEAAMLTLQHVINRLCATVQDREIHLKSRADAARTLDSIMAGMAGT
jgi:hypothetical protein